jgi:hypothetical protein
MYNLYQSCYQPTTYTNEARAARTALRPFFNVAKNYYNHEQQINYGSTDAEGGAPCFGDATNFAYLNLPEVQEALRISDEWKANITTWNDCRSEHASTP